MRDAGGENCGSERVIDRRRTERLERLCIGVQTAVIVMIQLGQTGTEWRKLIVIIVIRNDVPTSQPRYGRYR